MATVAALTIGFMVIVVALSVGAAIFLWWQKAASRDNADLIREGLARLLQRPLGSFLMVEEPSTGKVVQFSGSTEEPLFFDLPQQSLTLDEFERAVALFNELGFRGPETFAVYDGPGGPSAGTQTSFTVSFGEDVEGAAALALLVFKRVYGVKDSVPLALTKG